MFGCKGITPPPSKRTHGFVQGNSPALHLPIKIIARQSSAVPEASNFKLPGDVVEFVNHALHTCGFERHELVPEAIWAFHLDYYVAQVNNGGHGQFAYNSRWQQFILDDIQQALTTINAPEALQLFKSFTTFASMEPQRFAAICSDGRSRQNDDFIERLDQRFHAGLGDAIYDALKRWLSLSPAVQLFDDEGYRSAMVGLADRNPLRQERLDGREADARKKELANPLYQTAQFICRLTPGEISLKQVLNVLPFSNSDGCQFTIDTNAGIATIYMLPEKAALVVGNEESPRSKPPTDIILTYLSREGLTFPPELLWRAA